jgi:hypothetical protein
VLDFECSDLQERANAVALLRLDAGGNDRFSAVREQHDISGLDVRRRVFE